MKTTALPRAPQGVARKAPVRSTSARARSTPAKPLRPVDAKAPTPAPSPTAAPGLAPLLAGLLALIEAHRASAAKGPAAVLLRVLGEVAALALRFTAAPGAWRLADFIRSPDRDSALAAAGLSLVPAPPVEGAPEPAPAAPAAPLARPRLTPAHRSLVWSTESALVDLARTQQAADLLALHIEALPPDHWNLGAMNETNEALHRTLALLTDHLCEVAHELADAGSDATPMEHALALATLLRTAADDTRQLDALNARDARAALARFNRSSGD